MGDGKYAFEKSKIIHGDCLVEMKNIADKSVDMILADLPYGTTACKWDTIIPFEPLWKQYKRIIKDKGVIVLFGIGLFSAKLILSNEKMFKYDLIWNKEQGTNQFLKNIKPLTKHEQILIFYNKRCTYNPIMIGAWRREIKIRIETSNEITGTESKIKTNYDNKGLKYPTSIIDVNREHWRNGRYHPTQKPILLIQWLVQTYTNEGDIVLDNVAGSGTTGVACMNLNRDFILIEKELNYYEIIKERLGDFKNILL